MPNARLLLYSLCIAAIAVPVWAQQAPARRHIDVTAVMSPNATTAIGTTPVPSTIMQQPGFFGPALEPIKTEIADLRNRMAALDGRETQRNSATIDALTALNSSSTSQRGALADIQATLDRIETRLKKLETAAPQ
jgi:uncharacterized coiled-coil protein SlyX